MTTIESLHALLSDAAEHIRELRSANTELRRQVEQASRRFFCLHCNAAYDVPEGEDVRRSLISHIARCEKSTLRKAAAEIVRLRRYEDLADSFVAEVKRARRVEAAKGRAAPTPSDTVPSRYGSTLKS